MIHIQAVKIKPGLCIAFKSLFSVILLLGCLGQPVYAAEWTWPPSEGKANVSIIGPVVISGLDTLSDDQKLFYNQLMESMNKVAAEKEIKLPASYLEFVQSIKRIEFEMGSYDEIIKTVEIAWGTIESKVRAGDGVVPENKTVSTAVTSGYQAQGIYEKIHDLELTISINFGISDFNNKLCYLEGYRYIRSVGGQSKAEWFGLPVDFSKKDLKEMISQAVMFLLILPFYETDVEEFSVREKPVRLWQDNDSPVILSSKSPNFRLENTPITSRFYDQGTKIGKYPKSEQSDRDYISVPQKELAESICKDRKKTLITKNMLPFLGEEHATITENESFWVKDSPSPLKISNEGLNYRQIRTETGGGYVWCQQVESDVTTDTILKTKDEYVMEKDDLDLFWHRPNGRNIEEGQLFRVSGNAVEVTGHLNNHPNVLKGTILNQKNEVALTTDAEVSVYSDDFHYMMGTLATQMVDITLVGENKESKLTGIPVTATGFTMGGKYSSMMYSAGIEYWGLNYEGATSNGDPVNIAVQSGFSNLFLEIGMERPAYFMNGLRWGVFGKVSSVAITQEKSMPTRSTQTTEEIRAVVPQFYGNLSYDMDPIIVYLGLGLMTGAEFAFSNGDPYFTSAKIEGAASAIIGFRYIFTDY